MQSSVSTTVISFFTLLSPSPFVSASFLPQVKTHPVLSISFFRSHNLLCPFLLLIPPAPFTLLVPAALRVVALELGTTDERKLMTLVFLGLDYFAQNDLL